MNTISLLYNLGFRELKLIPYFPGMEPAVSPDIDVAITPGLWDIGPAHITNVIDVSGKEMDLSTFAELFTYLNRLCTLPILIPPLWNRKTYIIYLVEFFAKNCQHTLRLSAALTDFLLSYDWPGNISELQNVVQYLYEVLNEARAGRSPICRRI